MRFPQRDPEKEQQRTELSSFLEKIRALAPGEKITMERMFFEVSIPVMGIRYSPEENILEGNIIVESFKKAKTSVGYQVYTDKNHSLILVSNAMDYPCIDWTLEGGMPSKDNLTGEYFLKLPLSNFIRGSEARISLKKSKASMEYN